MPCNKCKHKKCKKCKKGAGFDFLKNELRPTKGAGLEDEEEVEEPPPKKSAGEVIRDVVSMTPMGAAARFVSDLFIPEAPLAAVADPADIARWVEQRRIAHIQHGGHSGSGMF